MKLKKALYIFLLLLPPLFYLIYLNMFSMNIIHYDEWELPSLLERTVTGKAGISEIFAFRNEHRPALPMAIMLLLGSATALNVKAYMYFGFAVLCAMSALLFRMISKHTEGNERYLLFLPVQLVLFNLGQWETALWGIAAVPWYLFALFSVLALYLYSESKGFDRSFFFSAAAAGLAALTTAGSLAAWASPAAMSLNGRTDRPKAVRAFVFLAIGVTLSFAYFWGMPHPTGHPSLFFSLTHPGTAMRYFFGFLGNIATVSSLAVPGGMLLAGFYMHSLLRHKDASKGPYALMMLFTIITAAGLALSRSGFGHEQALVTRYMILSSIGMIGAYLLAVSTAADKQKVLLFAIPVSLLLYLNAAVFGIGVAIDQVKVKEANRTKIIEFAASGKGDISGLWLHPEIIPEAVGIMKARKWNIFSGDMQHDKIRDR